MTSRREHIYSITSDGPKGKGQNKAKELVENLVKCISWPTLYGESEHPQEYAFGSVGRVAELLDRGKLCGPAGYMS